MRARVYLDPKAANTYRENIAFRIDLEAYTGRKQLRCLHTHKRNAQRWHREPGSLVRPSSVGRIVCVYMFGIEAEFAENSARKYFFLAPPMTTIRGREDGFKICLLIERSLPRAKPTAPWSSPRAGRSPSRSRVPFVRAWPPSLPARFQNHGEGESATAAQHDSLAWPVACCR